MELKKEDILEGLTSLEIAEALHEPLQPAVNSIEESAKELKAMGFRDISEYDQDEAMKEAMKNIQIQRTLSDIQRGTSDKRSAREYLEQHLDFLCRISPGKTKSDIISKMTVDHAAAVLKTTAKMEIPELVLKKHLKTLKKKYS
jgi:hypothetical protein